ncbi:MAG: hypothetical protein COW73_04690 [Nitrospirae bacterium CG18_big_fil_WC_8_21_14_2_50_70_55]|nr:MAG: hypothetical protein AUK30_09420 [Nitrospirae bacterium CG2_30_70_394]PIQ05797.1 MAG: hypothetical protein COW73_04690 [Nitrospirae bacterium CG18_big_fil_WC_8_21_14_2_50_70_55]PIU78616.1 MAG: hypothetical protein COS73_06715 [Nitrospirae bacterium CG06_land_8_20_14_3_00_70_43]PIW82473.1 MAG: hypothetical protein COZ96_08440 [Nitrospirae bacterium CG_4_8_14_3_um_filter_70_85]PIX82435.1 MAG: hypothetical protein COZ33_10585 [Nitrospirae bacterium CG_4_10_14_3_um_filter_70_108]PJB97296.1
MQLEQMGCMDSASNLQNNTMDSNYYRCYICGNYVFFHSGPQLEPPGPRKGSRFRHKMAHQDVEE